MAYVLVDDMTRVEITDPEHAPTVIAVDGHAVENDLSEESKAKLRELLAPYYAAGRVPGITPADVAAVFDVPERLVEPPAILSAKMAEPDLDDVEVPDERVPPPDDEPVVHVSPSAASPHGEPVPDAVIRAWAKRYGIDCPASRQVTNGVRSMYAACNGGAPKAGSRP